MNRFRWYTNKQISTFSKRSPTLRRSLAYALSTSILLPLMSQALTLGNIAVTSHLNQRFVAEIPLSNLHGVKTKALNVTLASGEMHERLNVSRPSYLHYFNFKVITKADGTPAIRISSKQKIQEPFIHFLLTVHWPNGKLLKQFRVLLDPKPSQRQAKPGLATSASRSATKPTVKAKPAAKLKMKDYGPVPTFSNLWRVAEEVRPDDTVSVEQVAVAILQFNQRAFIRGNMNGLKAGYRLKIPPVEQIRMVSPQQARAELKRQNIAWRKGTVITVAKPVLVTAQGENGQADTNNQSTEQKSTTNKAPQSPQVPLDKPMNMASLAEKVDLNTRNLLTPSLATNIAKPQTPQVITLTPSKQVNSLETNAKATVRTNTIQPQTTMGKLFQQQTMTEELALAKTINNTLQATVQKLTSQQQQLTIQYQQKQQEMQALQSQLNTTKANANDANESEFMWYLLMSAFGLGALLFIYRRYRHRETDAHLFNEIYPQQESTITAKLENAESTQTETKGNAQIAKQGEQLASANKEGNNIRKTVKSELIDVIEEARVYEAYERLPQAQAILEDAIVQYPERMDLKIELLRVYRLMGNNDAYLELRQQIPDSLQQQQPEQWQVLQTIEKIKFQKHESIDVENPQSDQSPQPTFENDTSDLNANEVEAHEIEFDQHQRMDNDTPVYDMNLNEISQGAAVQDDDTQEKDIDDNSIPYETGLLDKMVAENTAEKTYTAELEVAEEHLLKGDQQSAERLLNNVIKSGTSQQKAKAESLLEQIQALESSKNQAHS